MGEINTERLARCTDTLEKALELLQSVEPNSIEYELYQNALVKGFEMCLEQSGRLLRKRLAEYFGSKKEADRLNFKELFRYAGKHGLVDGAAVERWMKYRDNRNSTAHDYGAEFAKNTLGLMGDFVRDVRELRAVLDEGR